ncbi:MAG TPA: CocE/NonD family hydrolase [Vicinamibacterales bacterium]
MKVRASLVDAARTGTRSRIAALLIAVGLAPGLLGGSPSSVTTTLLASVRQAQAPARALPTDAQAPVEARYVKSEHEIPMRDGVRLFTAVYAPRDTSRTYPIMLLRTPYGVAPYGTDAYRTSLGPSPRFEQEGFIFVYQDVRGKFMSEGEFVQVRPYLPNKAAGQVDESTDTYDTIEWLLKNVPGHNGRVGMWGISYPGFYTSMGAIDAHPALKAVSPQAPVGDWFIGDDFRHNGAFFLAHAFRWITYHGRARPHRARSLPPRIQIPTPDGYAYFLQFPSLSAIDRDVLGGEVPFWTAAITHDTYDDFWKARNILPHLRNIAPAVLVVGGWFDAEDLYGALETYRAIERQSPRTDNRLVMGPWAHGQWAAEDGTALGDIAFGENTSAFYQEAIEFPFFMEHLKENGAAGLPEAYVFETGSNVWRRYPRWPPPEALERSFYLRAGGRLVAGQRPQAGEAASTEFISNPATPVPFIERTVNTMVREYMTTDQRFASRRPDVLVFQTPVLDEPLTVAGPVNVELVVSTTGTDADWVVKLIDVLPDSTPDPSPNPREVRMGGYQMLVRGEPFRGKFRTGFDSPQPFVPGRPATIRFTMPDVNHTFGRGHRIMVQIQSSWFPLVDRNPQKFMKIHQARPEDYQVATHRVYHSAARASRITVHAVAAVRGPSAAPRPVR